MSIVHYTMVSHEQDLAQDGTRRAHLSTRKIPLPGPYVFGAATCFVEPAGPVSIID